MRQRKRDEMKPLIFCPRFETHSGAVCDFEEKGQIGLRCMAGPRISSLEQ